MPTGVGTFDTTARPEPPFASDAAVVLGRMEIDKIFQGQLEGAGVVPMTYVRTPVEDSAGYVAVERISGSLDGRQGSFVVLHVGMARGGKSSLEVSVVPDSGTGDLTGTRGSMTLSESTGGHACTVDYELG